MCNRHMWDDEVWSVDRLGWEPYIKVGRKPQNMVRHRKEAIQAYIQEWDSPETMRVSSGQEFQTIVTIVVQEATWHGGSGVLEGDAKTDCNCSSHCNYLIVTLLYTFLWALYRKTEKHWNIWLASKLKSCDIKNHGKLSIGCWPSQGLQWSWAWLAFTHCLWSDTGLAGSSYC